MFGVCKGAFAEYASAPEARLVPKPESMSFDQAAAVPIAGLTALQGLRDKGHLQPGQKSPATVEIRRLRQLAPFVRQKPRSMSEIDSMTMSAPTPE